jgi:para-nitrobenzyl esterase
LNAVPMIIGANRDEGRLFAALDFNAAGQPISADQYPATVARLFGDDRAAAVTAQYPLDQYPDPGAAIGQALGDVGLFCPSIRSADLIAPHTNVFVYEYDHVPNPFVLPTPGIDMGAFHSAELPYVFAGPVLSSGAITFTPPEQDLSDRIVTAWTTFARTGDPGTATTPWPRYAPAAESYLALDTPPTVRTGKPRADPCAFWPSA